MEWRVLICRCSRGNFVSIICQACEGLQLTEDFCANFAKTLKFSYGQHLTFALALAQSTTPSVQQQGIVYLKVQSAGALGDACCNSEPYAMHCYSHAGRHQSDQIQVA